MKKRGNSNVFLHEIFSFTFRECSVAGSERLRKKLKMTTFQDIMRIIRSSNSFNITFSFSNVTTILKNLSQKSLSVQLIVLNFYIEEFYFTSWYNSIHSFHLSSSNCYLFLRGEIVVYISLQLGLSWRNQVTRTFLKVVACRDVQNRQYHHVFDKTCLKTWSLTMSRNAERKISVTEHEPETKKCFTSFLWS